MPTTATPLIPLDIIISFRFLSAKARLLLFQRLNEAGGQLSLCPILLEIS